MGGMPVVCTVRVCVEKNASGGRAGREVGEAAMATLKKITQQDQVVPRIRRWGGCVKRVYRGVSV